MTNEKAIKYLKQLYPNGGHCWLDEQRIEAIGMAVKALQEDPVSEDWETAAIQFATDTKTGKVDVVKQSSFLWGVIYHNQQMMAKAVDAIAQRYDAELWLDSQNDLKEFAEGEEVKVIILKKK